MLLIKVTRMQWLPEEVTSTLCNFYLFRFLNLEDNPMVEFWSNNTLPDIIYDLTHD